ncbi:hypothetical protein PILCRDRAFT_90993 [Piloderma croceum F 1598]|uniref:Uncharacterized protein n=1 Tax=Piloderma croceum (strain F 1598) TaxID=765440 RepID=A0A0C3FCX8_PILCF|nr:hypothetical protein PILCRDRAFT_90993 [Piloderma croceum F 1598]
MPVQPRSRLLERIYYQQHNSAPTFVPHYDRMSGDLVEWRWPVGGTGQRVTPTGLSEYRMRHRFQFPCCLCPIDEFEIEYTESAIYLPVFGPYAGNRHGAYVFNSRLVATAGPPPPPVIYMPTIGQRGASNLYASLPLCEPPNRAPESPFDQLLKLDSVFRPGLSEIEFRKLFSKCRCGTVTTRRVFKEHICLIAKEPRIIIDLTHSDDDSVMDLTSDIDD